MMTGRRLGNACPPHLQDCAECYARLPPEDMAGHATKHHPLIKEALDREQKRKRVFGAKPTVGVS